MSEEPRDEPAVPSHPLTYSRTMAERLVFGAPFDRTARDAALAQELRSGILTLPPHRAWRMPASITWRENPYREPNWVAQLHMLRWLDPLRRRALAGDVELLDTWWDIAGSWIRSNPPGRGRATYSWADMVEAARALTLAFALPALEDHRPQHVPTILDSLREHGEWLVDPRHIRTGNHALQQHQGLLVIGAVLERPEWIELAVERSSAMLMTSYDDQGVNEEGAVQYHQINYMWWNNLGRRVEIATGSTPETFRRVRRAPLAMAHATRPDGRYELIGDTEEFTPRNLGHPAIDWVASAGEQGIPPQDRVAVLDAGYVFGRSTWGDEHTPFDAAAFYSARFGPQDRIHGHVDGMALTLWAGGESLLVDSGKFAYDATDEHRRHLLSREAHNSVSVDGLAYDRTTRVELTLQRRHDAHEHFRFEDRGYRGVTLTRDLVISLELGVALVVDAFASEHEVTVHQWWHLHPDAGHRVEEHGLLAQTSANRMHLGWPAGTPRPRVTKGTTDPMQGWFSPSWRNIRPTRTVDVRTEGTRGRVVTALTFGPDSTPVSVDAVTDSEDGAVVVHLGRTGGTPLTIAISPRDSLLAVGHHAVEDTSKILD
ncbi:heparinase II/III domain-containing protein [Brachybacterium hainanense]|uniref:Heparinase II/III family protein n=1 Tax=Brachybacterium hainanense TaxID=1541174 RepID=A0ABV6RFD1_9MICO